MKKAQGESPAPLALVNDLYRDTLTGTLGYGADQSTDLLCDAALTTDHFAHVFWSYAQLQNRLTVILKLGDGDLIGMIHQVPGDIGQKFFQ